MQAIVFHGIRQLTLEDLPEPSPRADEVLIQVAACGICGSDLHGYLGHSARRTAHIPLVMGHEFSGTIVEIGSGVRQPLAVGERVVVQPQISCGHCRACRAGMPNICPNMEIVGIELPGAFAQYIAVPANRVFRLPDGLDEISATMTEPLAVEIHMFRQAAAALPRTIVVLGAGAQGLLAVQLARLSGASQIIVTDIVPERLALARTLGATDSIQVQEDDPIQRVLEATDNWGADFVIDAVGSPITRQQGVAMLAPGGTLGLVGLGRGETMLDFLPVINKELHIMGSYCYTDDEFERALQLIAMGQIELKDMLHVAPLAEGIPYFQQLIDEPASLTKVLLRT